LPILLYRAPGVRVLRSYCKFVNLAIQKLKKNPPAYFKIKSFYSKGNFRLSSPIEVLKSWEIREK
jgi:hypothetical protein